MSASQINQHGLKRSDLNAETKRIIRQECGFGCVICGNAIYQYEHIVPEFRDAITHNPNCMALLCGGCHDKVTRGRISKETVARARKNPRSLQNGYSFDAFDVGGLHPIIKIGSMSAHECDVIIAVNGHPVFWIKPPESLNAPYRMNAVLKNSEGEEIFRIIDNEWRTRSDSWDVETKGKRVIVRNEFGDNPLIIRTDPPNILHVEKLDMEIDGNLIRCDGKNFYVKTRFGQCIRSASFNAFKCKVALSVHDSGIEMGYGFGITELTDATIGKMNSTNNSININNKKIGRNKLCPCNSLKKFKFCCGRNL